MPEKKIDDNKFDSVAEVIDNYFGAGSFVALQRRPKFEPSHLLVSFANDRFRNMHLTNNLREERNEISEKMKDPALRIGEVGSNMKQRMSEIKKVLSDLETTLKTTDSEYKSAILSIPNTPSNKVPFGEDSSDNVIHHEGGEKPTFTFTPKSYVDLANSMGLYDPGRGTKIAASRFPVLYGPLAELEAALPYYFIQHHKRDGFRPVSIPHLANRESMTGTGQLPKFEEDMFRTTDDLFLIPTAEVPLTNLHSKEVLLDSQLPYRYMAYSRCFRREVGAAGKDTSGWKRVHDFGKVEMMTLSHPDKSWDELEHLTQSSEQILQSLGIHYRRVTLCTGDLGFASSFTWDLEAYMPSSDSWMEISSCSNYLDFQARRMNIKFKGTDTQKPTYIHTLNGSGFPVGRIMICLLEQFQQEDGSVHMPKQLHNILGFSQINPDGSTR